MTPALRFSFSLVLSLLLWLPTVPSALSSNDDPAMIAVRYLVALLVARLGVGLVFRIVGGYAGDVLADEGAEEEPEQADDFGRPNPVQDPVELSRRREDPTELDEADEEALLDAALDDAADSAALAS